ncbi:hypothetical protein ATK74_3041 [Propionicimonas paludicola]|uniref:Uncharacterized protein n=1 Tax=Propionicimonas paludicola TaxID=185243 RepID=A0A2A9CWE2_9ACTN|nr:hypothetical protein [Propionicimonas paludicola]PFG15493.1 hypothetical protein ATK74_0011 [Propionicimonas paludicola]PFG18451.1 hypothetical protein ATK74_3041 [Propionicimonas paludicola]
MTAQAAQGMVQARILITAKTYPTPSERHLETVCTAGVRLDTPQPEWVRLYPISFRLLDYDLQFKKYQIVEVPIRSRGAKDIRSESYTPDISRLISGEVIDSQRGKWTRRREMLGSLVGATTTCALISANKNLPPHTLGPSLGLVKPLNPQVSVTKGKPWNRAQQQKVARAAMPTLFDEDYVRNELEPQPYDMRVRYCCTDPACKGHDQSLIDWEVGQAGRTWSLRYPADEIPERLRAKWQGLFSEDKDAHLFVGNQLLHPQSFMGLGVWYPRKT